mgnify:FL=1
MKSFLLWLVFICALVGCSGSGENINLPAADSNNRTGANLSWFKRAAMDAYMKYSVWSENRSGFVTMFAQDGQVIHASAVGWADIESKKPMRIDTQMRFASMTKPVTAIAALILVDEGKLQLNDHVASYIPSFGDLRVAVNENKNANDVFDTRAIEKPLLVKHLLMFSSGIGPGYSNSTDLYKHWMANGIRSHKSGGLAERVEKLSRLPLFEEPGLVWRYGSSADVLARVVEVVSGQAFDMFLEERIFGPLGMTNTRFLHAVSDHHALAQVYTQDPNGELILAPKRIDSEWNEGGSGLVSNASDYMRFALMIWNGGEYDGVRIIPKQMISDMTSPHVKGGVFARRDVEGLGWGLGIGVVVKEDATLPGTIGDIFWGGYYGTTFFVSPSTGLVGVILSQNEMSQYSGGYQTPIYAIQAIAVSGS